MATGFFMGIKESYIDEARKDGENYIEAINKTLIENKIRGYIENEDIPDVYINDFFGQSGLDHYPSSSLAELAEYAETKIEAYHLRLVKLNPYRVAFVPIPFEYPLATDHTETFWGTQEVFLNFGSSYRLKDELLDLGQYLGIEFGNGGVINEHIQKINQFEPFKDGEAEDLSARFRVPWLLLYEGARLSIENEIALSLAG